MSLNVSKSSCKHSYDKCLSPGASNVSHDESELSIRTNDVNINADSYVNTPSPSSIASISTVDRPCKHRLSNLKSDFHPQMSSKRRYRYDRLFHYTNSLNRQYVITMTNILFQMQKDIFKLKRRTHHVEQMLANQIQSGQPIIRIPRLTRDDISTICVNNDATQQNISSEISEENENNNESPTTTTNNTQSPTTTTTTNNNELPTTTNNIEPLNEEKNDTENLSITLQTTSQTDTEINNQQEQQPRSISNKYCSECNHEFSHRSAYLRHMRRIHKRKYLSKSNKNNLLEADSTHNEPFAFTTDQPDNEIENESYQVLVNQWDIGEGRLRPRRVLKAKNEPINKVKCDICGKFFRTEYVKQTADSRQQAVYFWHMCLLFLVQNII